MPRKYHNAGPAGRDWGYLSLENPGDWDPVSVAVISVKSAHDVDYGIRLSREQCRDLADRLAELAGGTARAPMIEGEV